MNILTDILNNYDSTAFGALCLLIAGLIELLRRSIVKKDNQIDFHERLSKLEDKTEKIERIVDEIGNKIDCLVINLNKRQEKEQSNTKEIHNLLEGIKEQIEKKKNELNLLENGLKRIEENK